MIWSRCKQLKDIPLAYNNYPNSSIVKDKGPDMTNCGILEMRKQAQFIINPLPMKSRYDKQHPKNSNQVTGTWLGTDTHDCNF